MTNAYTRRQLLLYATSLAASLTLMGCEKSEQLTIAITTTTANSGLLDVLLPQFQKDTGIKTNAVITGTGKALHLAQSGDVDAIWIHNEYGEQRFIASDYGDQRHPVMYNDFIIIGPKQDPANIKLASNVFEAFKAIAQARQDFFSRGDDSGTHRKERQIWQTIHLSPWQTKQSWYKETGAGMGATLNTTTALEGYVFSDRATWLSHRNKGVHKILFEDQSKLRNNYALLTINPEKYPNLAHSNVAIWVSWLTGPTGQGIIQAFKVDQKQAFYPINTP